MKHKIRKHTRKKRRSVEEREKKCQEIMINLFSQEEFQNAKTVLLYMSKGSEVVTHDMVALAVQSKQIVLPVTLGSELVLADLDGELIPGAYGILEPDSKSFVNPEKVDLAIIPGVAFDKKGARIGYGKGYYDKLLARMDCPKFALAFKDQLVDNIPCESHDVNVDKIVTEDGVIECVA